MLPNLLLILFLITNPVNKPEPVSTPIQLASRTISLNDRYGSPSVNDVFKYNILLTLGYMDGLVSAKDQISVSEVEKPFHYEFSLDPGERFAFHDQMLPEYAKKVVKTTNGHFNYQEGFKSDRHLTGDGVCHLASLIYWVAKEAGLSAYAPSNHNFASIPDVPKEYGVAVYVRTDTGEGAYSNLYIINDGPRPIKFVFDYNQAGHLNVSVKENKSI